MKQSAGEGGKKLARVSKRTTTIELLGKIKIIKFCADCHEYVMDDGYCSNPFCPEEQS